MKRNYLLRRPGSQNWRLRLQDGGKSVERSLGTPDRMQAEILAAPLIAEHRAMILARRPMLTPIELQHKLEPGRTHVNPDGGTIVANSPRTDLSRRERHRDPDRTERGHVVIEVDRMAATGAAVHSIAHPHARRSIRPARNHTPRAEGRRR